MEPAPGSAPAAAPPAIRGDPNPGLLRCLLHAVYDIGWWVFLALYSPGWLTKSARDPAYRRMARGRLTIDLPDPPAPGDPPRILIHGVSVGEVKAAQSLVRAIERQLPDHEVVISTITVTGHAEARRLYPHLRVASFPLEPSFFVRRFLRAVRPACAVLVELEAWPNFLRGTNRAGVPIAVVNGRITKRSFKSYLRFRTLMPQFNRFTLMCAQDEVYARRFERLARQPERVVVTGNIKWDSLRVGRLEPGGELRRWLDPGDGRPVVVAGSTHGPEERWLAAAWRDHFPRARLVLVPRHPDRATQVRRALEDEGVSPQFLSALRAGAEAPDPARPVVIDTIGELERVYGLADLVFIGGSLVEHGGQNMLEPAAQGLPVLYGPHVDNFVHEAELLERAGAAERLSGVQELGPRVAELLSDAPRREAMAAAGMRATGGWRGAAELCLRAIRERCLGHTPPPPSAEEAEAVARSSLREYPGAPVTPR